MTKNVFETLGMDQKKKDNMEIYKLSDYSEHPNDADGHDVQVEESRYLDCFNPHLEKTKTCILNHCSNLRFPAFPFSSMIWHLFFKHTLLASFLVPHEALVLKTFLLDFFKPAHIVSRITFFPKSLPQVLFSVLTTVLVTVLVL